MHERIPITHPESVTPILNESSQAEPRQKKEYVLFEEVRPEVLVAQYLGELFIYKAMQNANVFTLQRIAESYCDLPDYLQHQFDQTAGNKNKNITQIIALSYARNGDFTRADEELHPQDGSHPPITFAVSYAVTLAQHEEDPSEAYAIALEAAVSEKNLDELERIINSQQRTGQDTQAALEQYLLLVQQKKDDEYARYTYSDRYEKLLLQSGRVEEALTYVKEEVSNPAVLERVIKDLEPKIAEALIIRGDVENGLAMLQQYFQYDASKLFTSISQILLSKDELVSRDAVLFQTNDELFVQLEKSKQIQHGVLVKKAEIDLLQKRDITEHLDTLLSFSESSDPVSAVSDLQDIITLTEKIGGDTAPLLEKLKEKISRMTTTLDLNDKLDGVEGLIAYENAVQFLTDHTYLQDAVRMAEEYEDTFLQADGTTVAEEEFTDVIMIEIGQKYLALAKNNGIRDLKRTQYLKALGYSKPQQDISSFSTADQALIEIGRKQWAIISGDIADEMETQFQRGSRAVKARENINEAELEILRTQLEQELGENNDPRNIRRFVKELLEIGDPKIQEYAIAMFTDPEQPLHFRLYLAKKLCHEGIWDRQILYYFKQYKTEAEKTPQANDRLETLGTIITEMHQTPHLEMYKVLERTRHERDPEAMEKVARLGAEACLIENLDLKDKIEVFAFWGDKYTSGQISEKRLTELTHHIQSLGNAWVAYRDAHSTFDKHQNIKISSRKLLLSTEIFSGLAEAKTLLHLGIFPTRTLLQRMKEPNALEEITALQEETRNGRFDKHNDIQRDLEFTKFMKVADKASLPILEEIFTNLSSSEASSSSPELSYKEKYEASAAAYECAKLYWFIKGLKERGREVVVIGNKRYGEYFVTEPLRWDLNKLGVSMRDLYIHSTAANEDSYPENIPDTFVQLLAEETPDIVIVDGTKQITENISRLPNSFLSFRNWFAAFNNAQQKQQEESSVKDTNARLERLASFEPKLPYQVRFWTPAEDKQIKLGQSVLSEQEPDETLPAVYFVNAVINPQSYPNYPSDLNKHIPGYFDDPDTHIVGKDHLVFTRYGIKNTGEKFSLEDDYVHEVQQEIERHIPEYIRRTDPLVGQNQTAEYKSTYRFSGS